MLRNIANGSHISAIARRTKEGERVGGAATRSTSIPSIRSTIHAVPDIGDGTMTMGRCPSAASCCARSRSCTAAEVRSGG